MLNLLSSCINRPAKILILFVIVWMVFVLFSLCEQREKMLFEDISTLIVGVSQADVIVILSVTWTIVFLGKGCPIVGVEHGDEIV